MELSDSWEDLLGELGDLSTDTTLRTPLSRDSFHVTTANGECVTIEYRSDGVTDQLEYAKFERLFNRVRDAPDGFSTDRLPTNAEPYASVLSLHPMVELDDETGLVAISDSTTNSPLLEKESGEPSVNRGSKRSSEDSGVTLSTMLDNMSDNVSDVTCPIEGCNYSHRSAASVARHVSGSSTDKHIWENTSYSGWRDFVRQHE